MASSGAPNPATASDPGVPRPTSITSSGTNPAPRSSYTPTPAENPQAGSTSSRKSKKRRHRESDRFEEGTSESSRRSKKRAHRNQSSDALPHASKDPTDLHGSEAPSRSKESDEASRARKHTRKVAKREKCAREAAGALATADGGGDAGTAA